MLADDLSFRQEKTLKTVSYCMMTALLMALAACVTINVYFPEAAAQEAADRFIDEVIGPDEAPDAEGEADAFVPAPQGATSALPAAALAILDWVIPPAHAQVNIDINTPEIRAIQSRMNARFSKDLSKHFASGAIGLTNDARVAVRDLSSVSLRDRSALNAAVAADNRDRDAVYREIAIANGQPSWEAQIRETFARQWVSNARSGWYYQDSAGNWRQK